MMVTRYGHGDRAMESDINGTWVEHRDYVALLAERDALAAQVEAMKGDAEQWRSFVAQIEEAKKLVGSTTSAAIDAARQETKP